LQNEVKRPAAGLIPKQLTGNSLFEIELDPRA
jgi:hypothetical protein